MENRSVFFFLYNKKRLLEKMDEKVIKCEKNHNKTIYKKKIMLYDVYVK